MKKNPVYASIWDALEASPGEAANLKVRADLMRKITAAIEAMAMTQAVAAERCGISQPRINDLLNGKVSRFSIDALVNIAASLGRPVQIKLAKAS